MPPPRRTSARTAAPAPHGRRRPPTASGWAACPAEARADLLTRLAADAVGAPLGNADDRTCHLRQQAREDGAEFRLTPRDVPLHLRSEHIRAALDLRTAAQRQTAR